MNGNNNMKLINSQKSITSISRSKYLSTFQVNTLREVNINKFRAMSYSEERFTTGKNILSFIGSLSSAQALLLFVTEGLIDYNLTDEYDEVSMKLYQFKVPYNSKVLSLISEYIYAGESLCNKSKALRSKFRLNTKKLSDRITQVQIIDTYPSKADKNIYEMINNMNCILINWVLTDTSELMFDDCFKHHDTNKSITLVNREYKKIPPTKEYVMELIIRSLKDSQHTNYQHVESPAIKILSRKNPKLWSAVVEPIEEPIEEPVLEPIEEPIEEPVLEPIEEPVLEPIEEPVLEPIVDPIEKPVDGNDEGDIEYVTLRKEDAASTIHNLNCQLNCLTQQFNFQHNHVISLEGTIRFRDQEIYEISEENKSLKVIIENLKKKLPEEEKPLETVEEEKLPEEEKPLKEE